MIFKDLLLAVMTLVIINIINFYFGGMLALKQGSGIGLVVLKLAQCMLPQGQVNMASVTISFRKLAS